MNSGATHPRRLVFFNFAIDQLWDSQGLLKVIFPHRIPESERIVRAVEDLALYVARPGDITLISSLATNELIQERKSTSDLDLRVIKANPYDIDLWLAEVEGCLKTDFARSQFELWPIGLSALELQLLKRNSQLRLPAWMDVQTDFVNLNRKSTILDWANIGKIECPPTNTINSASLLSGNGFSDLKFPIVLKADFSSGGGGNFLIRTATDNQLRVLKRRLHGNEDIKATWIAQQWQDGCTNLSVYGWANDATPEVCQIDYDENGLSRRHRLSTNLQQNTHCEDCFLHIKAHLNSLGYQGPLGLDILFDRNQNPYLIDVNVRLTKTHLISIAANELAPSRNWISLRLKTQGGSVQPFIKWAAQQTDVQAYHQAANREVSVFVSADRPGQDNHVIDNFTRLTFG